MKRYNIKKLRTLFNTNILLIFAVSCTIACFSLSACTSKEKPQKSVLSTGRLIEPTDSLYFLSKEGKIKSSLFVKVVTSEEDRNLGLMNVRKLPMQHGMLFKFELAQPLNFWMANTPLSLDIIFLDSDSTILNIHKSTTAFSSSQYGSEGKKAQFVVETNANYCTLYDINVGDRIRF